MLRPRLSFEGGLAALGAIKSLSGVDLDGDGAADALGRALAPIYLRHGVVDWNLIGKDGERVPVEEATIADLDWPTAYAIADAADDLYGSQLLSPLVERQQRSSRTGRTASLTSVKPPSGSPRQKRSA